MFDISWIEHLSDNRDYIILPIVVTAQINQVKYQRYIGIRPKPNSRILNKFFKDSEIKTEQF